MGFDFGWVGAGRLLAGAILAGMAALIFFARSSGQQNRRLALFLFVMGCLESARGLATVSDNVGQATALWMVVGVLTTGAPFVYLRFLATMRTPIVAWARSRVADALIVAAAVTVPLLALILVRPEALGIRVGEDFLTRRVDQVDLGSIQFIVAAASLLAFTSLFAAVVSISAFRRSAPGSVARRQAKAYMHAFLIFDGWFVAVNILIRPFLASQGDIWLLASQFGGPFIFQPLFAGFLTYGILKTHLFDIDLKIKWTISRGTIAVAFIAVFVGVSAAMQEWLGQSQGVVAGGLAAGFLVFALHPLQRLAERISNAALPNVQDSPEYRRSRKLDVYRDAVETLLVDGVITDKERTLLARLSGQLEIAPTEAVAVERAVRASLAPPTASKPRRAMAG